ncbi:MAG: hypothetical protein NVS2B3_02960 [Vulcanimicrobiaceae bacterium]
MTLASRMRALAYAICALLTATLGDVLVEAFQNCGAFGTSAIDANHQGVLPVLGLAAFLLVVLAASIAHDRFRCDAVRADPLAEIARDIARSAVGVRLATIVAWSLALVFVTEEYERGFGGGTPFDLAHATPGDALASLVVYVACAMLVTLGLGIVVRALGSTCDAFARIVAAFASLFERRFGAVSTSRARPRPIVFQRSFRLSGPFPDRAPPVVA